MSCPTKWHCNVVCVCVGVCVFRDGCLFCIMTTTTQTSRELLSGKVAIFIWAAPYHRQNT